MSIENPFSEIEQSNSEIEQSKNENESKNNSTETAPENSHLPEYVEHSLEVAEGHFQKLEEDLAIANTSIEAIGQMPAGSQEQYDAVFKMRADFENILFASATTEAILNNANTSTSLRKKSSPTASYENQYPPEIQAAQQKLEEMKIKYTETNQKMMDVWQTVKQEYESKLT